MKNNFYKAALLAALGLAGVVNSNAATYNQDLLVGFTTTSGNDLVFDLGSSASVLAGTAGTADTWDLSSLLVGNLSTVSADQWGVIGDNKTAQSPAHAVFSTANITAPISGTSAWAPYDTATKGIYSSLTTAGAGQYAYVDATTANSWNVQTISPSLTTQYYNVDGANNPNTLGAASLNLNEILNDGSAASVVGAFSLSSAGLLSFTPTAVPEPGTYGMLAGAGLLVVSLRKQFRRKQA